MDLERIAKLNTIIIPAWREEKGLAVVLTKVFQMIDDTYEVIVVDDGSDDASAQVASQFPCRVIRHELNRGKGEALKTGIRQARGENIIWIDADDTYPVELIPQIVEGLVSHDMVVCSRKFGRENIPCLNRIGSLVFRHAIRTIYGFMPYDPFSGLCGVKKRYLEMMNLSSQRFAIEPEISIKGSRMKLKMVDIPIEYQARVGDTKLNWVKVGFEDLWTILRLIHWRPTKGRNG
ncbi:Undecaprenyl-phosphate 4-deoxy-4-formamido-L-arabinose transferase [subsurface metagenome]